MLTKERRDGRLLESNGCGHYPPNDGAVRCTRVDYSCLDAFTRHYDGQFDCTAPPGGEYLGLKVDGVAASFEVRVLPIGSLAKDCFSYALNTVPLPVDWSIEVSKIAPAVQA